MSRVRVDDVPLGLLLGRGSLDCHLMCDPVVDGWPCALADQVVGAADEDAEGDDGEDHHQRVAIELAPRGPDDLAQLVENLTQKSTGATFGFGLGALLGCDGHGNYFVSLCAVCLWHQRQYLLSSSRSGSFFLFFTVV